MKPIAAVTEAEIITALTASLAQLEAMKSLRAMMVALDNLRTTQPATYASMLAIGRRETQEES